MTASTDELLAELSRLGVRIAAEGAQLRINAPKGTLTPELRAAVQARKPELLEHLRATEQDPIGSRPLQRYPRAAVLPLSYGQERLWFLDQLGVGAVYNIPWGTVLTGRIDVAAIERAINEIVRRHEVLRATFRVVDGRPATIIAPELHIPLRVVDIQHLPTAAARDAEVLRLAGLEEQTPFDLARGPLLRPLLVRVEPEAYALSFTIHHIVFDFWSVGVLAREFGTLYDAFRSGRPSPLPELPLQYVDFACWQRDRLARGELDAQLAYWRERLADAPAGTDLPWDRPRPPLQSYRGEPETIFLSAELTAQLKNICRQAGATPFMVLLAAFKALLLRYSGQTDIVIGTPIAGRNEQQLEGLIGIFLNTLALRTDLSGDPSFLDLLARVRDTALGAYANQDLPFERIVEEIRPERDPSRTPLFQVLFNLFNVAAQPVKVQGVGGRSFTVSEGTAKFDLTIYGLERPTGLVLSAVYNVDLFNAATITRLMGHYRVLLEAVAADPTTRLSRLPLLTAEEHAAIRAPAPALQPRTDYIEFPRSEVDQSLPARFAAVVARDPHHPAVRTRHHAWSYAELDAHAQAVAGGLAARRPAGPQRLALLVDHDAPMIAAVFGALRAGITYVPLDPTYPRARLVDTLGDAQAWGVLTSRRHRPLTVELADGGLQILELEELLEAKRSAPLPAGSADDPAYLLYTSGSTGRPKGVLQSHRNVLHYARATANGLHLRADDRVTLLASLGFDAAVVDIFSTLMTGATLLPRDIRTEGLEGLDDWLTECGATVYHSTPTVFRHFVRALPPGRVLPDVRLVVLGGEASLAEDVRRFRRHFAPPALFVNLMGASEASTASLWFTDHDAPLERETLPLGQPVADTELLLLDEHGAPTELLGELAIRSQHVALGYWNRPELTAAAFSTDITDPQRRIYRTGDWARRLPTGELGFVGRRDQQVKVRGARVELAEIELALAAHPDVAEAATRYFPEAERIVAYVVRKTGSLTGAGEFREALRARLPDYMLPSTFVFLVALPLTTSGKINRRALPSPALTAEPTRYAPPRTPTEQLLAELWMAALQIDRVSVYDNFFDLGGHSLLLIRVIAQFEERTGTRINPVEFIRQTLGQIAAQHAASVPGTLAPEASAATHPAGGVEPAYFGPPARALFGCYTFAPGAAERAVVICPPALHEYIRCHRPLRLLAHRLAEAGLPALRFDYSGCGDSRGNSEDARLDRWQEDVHTAIDALKARLGPARITLLGWRLGANLALAAAAERTDLDALVLWDPLENGAAYLDELRASGTSLSAGNGHAGTTVLDISAAPVTDALARDLQGLPALAYPPARDLRTLLLRTGTPSSPAAAVADSRFVQQVVVDSRVWLQEPFEAIVPQKCIRELVTWLSGGAP